MMQHANIHREIEKLRNKGLTYGQIAEKLNAQGMKGTQGQKFNTSSISYYLTKTPVVASRAEKTVNSKFINKILTDSTLRTDEVVRILRGYFNV